MTNLLWTVIQLSLAGTLLGLVVLVATRALGKRISRAAGYYLWLLVLLRLVLPVGLPGRRAGFAGRIRRRDPGGPGHHRAGLRPGAGAPKPRRKLQPAGPDPRRPPLLTPFGAGGAAVLQALPWVWLGGVVISLGWVFFSYHRFRRKLTRTSQAPQPGR